jgi:hypothetical protein
MAASIPVLRVLFVRAKSSAERYYASGRKGSARLGSNPSRNNTIVTASRKKGYMAESDEAGDDRSDRSILDTPSPGTGKILQANEISDDREGWYQMDRVGKAV